MKTILLSLVIATGLTATAQAQIFRPRTANNILVGSIAGAIIGENNNHRALEGAAIGAAAGLVWSAATESRGQPRHAPPVPVVRDCAPLVSVPVYGPAPCGVVVHHRSAVVCRPAPRVVYVAPTPVYWAGRGHYHHRGHHRRW